MGTVMPVPWVDADVVVAEPDEKSEMPEIDVVVTCTFTVGDTGVDDLGMTELVVNESRIAATSDSSK